MKCSIVADELEAVFLPGQGMLGGSLRHRGAEALRRIDDLDRAAADASTAGIPLLHPWAKLAWELTDAAHDRLAARLDWAGDDLLAIFPFPQRLEIKASVAGDGLTLEAVLVPGADAPVPVSFGFHPYLGIPDLPREQWRLKLPAMRRLALDSRGIPTGEEEMFDGWDAPLAAFDFDQGFAALDERASLTIAGAGRRISIGLRAGYRYAQVFAPKGEDCIALEPMTAPANALVSGRGLRLVEPGGRFRAAFRIRVDAAHERVRSDRKGNASRTAR